MSICQQIYRKVAGFCRKQPRNAIGTFFENGMAVVEAKAEAAREKCLTIKNGGVLCYQ